MKTQNFESAEKRIQKADDLRLLWLHDGPPEDPGELRPWLVAGQGGWIIQPV